MSIVRDDRGSERRSQSKPRTQDGLDLVSRQGGLGLPPLVVHDARDGVRRQALPLVQPPQQVVGQLLGCGSGVTALQQLGGNELRTRADGESRGPLKHRKRPSKR